MNDDIVVRLREEAKVADSHGSYGAAVVIEEAADEIERLRGEKSTFSHREEDK